MRQARRKWCRVLSLAAVCLLALGAARPTLAQGNGYESDWHTVDGGGYTFSTGGGYELGGTIGQHDAGVHGAGLYTLGGGFWQLIDPVLRIYAAPPVGADITGIPEAASGTTDYEVVLEDGTVVSLTAPGTVTVGEETYAFLHWDLDGTPQTDYQTTVAFPLLGDMTAMAVYLSPPGPLVVDMDVTVGGKLNPDGPAPMSLGIQSVGLAGNPSDTPIAIKVGDQPDSGWLQFGHGFPPTDPDDLFPVATQPAWHTALEWAARLRGLTPATAYTFYAKAQAGTHETSLSQFGPFETSDDCDVNRTGAVSGLDYALIKACIIHSVFKWPCDVDDSRTLDSADLGDTMSGAIGP